MFKKILVAIAAVLLLPFAASATPITYSYTGVGSGSFNGQAFRNTEFVITAQADTDNIGGWCCSNAQNTHSSTSISLDGFGTFSFLSSTHTWIAESCCMGFGNNLASNYITLDGVPALLNVGYGLDTAIGPITDFSPTTHGQFNNVGTSGGLLTISSLDHVTFEAVTTAVPEPSTYALMAMGLFGVAAVARRRAAKA